MTHPFKLSPIEAKTKGEMKRLRKAGFVPVSLQHKGMSTLHFQQESKPLDEFIRRYGDAALLDLLIVSDDRHQRAIVQDVQRDCLTGGLLQVTFQQVRHDDTLKTHVLLVFAGEPLGVHLNEAVVQHQLNQLDIECTQDSLPDRITVNIAHLLPGDVVRVSDLPANPRYKILTASDTVLASLSSIRAGTADEQTEETTETLPAGE